jgi:hypothetical protein
MSMEDVSGTTDTSASTPTPSAPTPAAPAVESSGGKETAKAPQTLADKIIKGSSSAGAASATSQTSKDEDPLTDPSAPVFTPNYKFKANQKEMEFDEFLRAAIKDPESEKKVRELYEKAHGLDTIKPERDKYKQDYQTIEKEWTTTKKGIDTLSHYVRTKDYESFFQSLGIPKSDVMQYALLQLQLQDASPEQRAAYEASRQQNLTSYTLEQQNQILQEHVRGQANTMRANELEASLQKPEVNALMQAFDQRLGRVGAFRDEVIRRGQLYWHQNQVDIPVTQAIQEVMNLIGPSLQAQGGTTQGMSAPTATAATLPKQQPTIPTIKGNGNMSPARAVPKRISDLKKLSKEMDARERRT